MLSSVCLLCVLLASAASFPLGNYEGYQVWRITPNNGNQREWLRTLQESKEDGLEFWSDVMRIPGHPVDIMVQPDRQPSLRMRTVEQGLKVDVMIDDVGALVANQMFSIQRRRESGVGANALTFDYNVYHTYEEIQQWVMDVVSENSDILSHFIVGTSYEGRTINGFRIRGTGSTASNPPAVWFEGGIHAREWVSPATVMGFTQKLIDDYRAGDQLALEMFDNMDWYIVPSLNADGYAYTWTRDRLWRKTRTPNKGSSCVGTDPNRNWPFEWGGVGTSPWACSETYHGAAALSEREVEAVVDFCRGKKLAGQDFMVFIDWHSYSQVIIAPWSYLDSNPRTEDYDDQMALAQAMSSAISQTSGKSYGYGAGAEILYPASGSSKDYGYAAFTQWGGNTSGGLGAKYSYTVELRDTGEYGFLLPENQIQDTYEEIHAAVRALGRHVLTTDLGITV